MVTRSPLIRGIYKMIDLEIETITSKTTMILVTSILLE